MRRREPTIEEVTGWQMLAAVGGGIGKGLLYFPIGYVVLRGALWLIAG